ncbi:DNA/RNA nuclease SfsA [Lutispora thermophila]|uniref:Sugar fermentation stimulation protein homolog n=1 Tax=Lutispora thermophila DSM 19022 TaxID=1122184 RepID=A0A1M6FHY4_9FIRM|nr:DNA/RNA nuclease SfsA [Lutispora thermophila]SHI97324.1 sugar fermentation stimulation protein A [Lutispora thermophila DSM 19022]
MKYKEVIEAQFIKRPNRFLAHVLVDGKEEIVHVRNTGRCREILIEGTKVILEKSKNPNRKTAYSLIAAYKGNTLINIDSQIPNAVVFEGIKNNKISEILNVENIKREVTYGDSRFDIYFEREDSKGFIEVKGVTLEENGLAMFPDAPTERGRKHMEEMADAVANGYEGYIIFLIQMKGVKAFSPNFAMDPEFSEELRKSASLGVKVMAYDAVVKKDEIIISDPITVIGL